MSTKVTYSLITLLILAVAGLSYLVYQSESKLDIVSLQAGKTEIKNIVDTLPKEETHAPDFRLEMYANEEDSYLLDGYEKVVAIESMNKLCGKKVSIYVGDNINQRFFMKDFNPGSDRPIQEIYRVDTQAKPITCSKLPFDNYIGDFGGYRLSPEHTKLAVALEKSPREIRVLNLITGEVKLVATAKVGDTFNAGWGGLSNNFIFIWTDEQTLQYDTFKEVTYENRTAEGGKPLISTQVIRVE